MDTTTFGWLWPGIPSHAHTRLDLLQVHSDDQQGMVRFQIIQNERLIRLYGNEIIFPQCNAQKFKK